MKSKPDFREKQYRLREAFSRTKVKLTHQRLVIFNAVSDSTDHPDVETVYRRVHRILPSVSLDTVYRTLWLLLDLGLIGTFGPSQGKVRFDGNTMLHHHFVCSACGAIQDFVHSEYDRLGIPAPVRVMGKIEQIHVELRGLCKRCSDKKKI